MSDNTQCICFDFDGTIADSYHLFIQKIQLVAQEIGYDRISEEEIEHLRGKHVRDIVKQFKIPYYKIPWLVVRLRMEMHKGMHHVAPVEGMLQVISTLKKEGYLLGIVSSNSEKVVGEFLERNQQEDFDFLACNSNLFGKVITLKWVLQKNHLQPEMTVYIGDEMRDAEAAKKTGMRFGAVAWGYNTFQSLKAYDPDYAFESPADITTAFSKK